ncbi:MAG TPA: GAF domain-containing sensor histidine kinase [Gemmatimonadaceae bacterium]|nr:GAF domain-containing sensor histidine kinase [Gemmatimonadaceae bacterium]
MTRDDVTDSAETPPGDRVRAPSPAIARARELEIQVRAVAERLPTPEERAVEIVDAALDALGASIGIAMRRTVDGRALEMVGAAHVPDDVLAVFQHIPIDAALPVAEAARTGRASFCETREQLLSRYPTLRELAERLNVHAVAAVPTRYLGELQGAVAFCFSTPRTFSAGEKAVLRALGARYARALRDARRYFAEHDARTAEAAARRAAEEARTVAEAVARTQGDFVAVVSHELRTPLQAILGYAELMADGVTGELTPQQRDFMRRIAVGSLSLLQIVENLLDFSAAQIGRQRADVESFQLRELITDVVAFAEPLAARKQIIVRADVPAITMRSDPRRIRQIVTNLVGNAIKFTERGEVVVGATVGAPMSPGGATPTPACVRIAVRDTGAGIAAADVPKLFEPFWQGQPVATASVSGTGLGLSIVRQLARLLGGDVQVESAPGAGSTFTVTLPLEAPTTTLRLERQPDVDASAAGTG